MSLLQQLISYLSQPPDSIVYHIVTLLALQATLALAWWQARQKPEDDFARRLAWASGAILVSRLLILLALFATSGLVEATVLLPPLERAVDAVAVALLVWALSPRPRNLPHLNTALLLILAIVIAFLFVAFVGKWQALVDGGEAGAGYSATDQAFVWNILQLALLGVGGALVLYARESQWSLRLAILVVLFIAQALNLVLGGSQGPPNVDVSIWRRLGNIIAFPMLAVLAYRHNLQYLLPASQLGRSGISRLRQAFELSSHVTRSLQPNQTVEDALILVSELTLAPFVAIAYVIDDRPQNLQITAGSAEEAELSDDRAPATRTWVLRRDDWPSLSTALHEKRQVELIPNGSGARQLHEIRQELGLANRVALLIQPLLVDAREIGLLILASPSTSTPWSEDEKELIHAIGMFLAHALDNALRYRLALAGQTPDFEREIAVLKSDLDQITQQRDMALDQTSQLNGQLSKYRERLDADHRKLRETTEALALAVQRQTKVRQLEEELDGLREALSEAELALASAAAGEAGLSAEWVMRTVTRYSGELEEAQARISYLERQLNQPGAHELLERAAIISSRLRTPLTALGGYTDLLLDQAAGEISHEQESLLRRMRVNVDNLALTVDSLAASTRPGTTLQTSETSIDVHEALQEAIQAVSAELQAKKLRVDLFVEDELPLLQGPDDGLKELLVRLLQAAYLVSTPYGRLHLSARRVPHIDKFGRSTDHSYFLRVSIRDDGAEHSHSLYAEAIAKQETPRQGRVSPESKELAGILKTAKGIASARGGRCWLDLTLEKGSVLILLLPTPAVATDTGD